MRLKEIQEVLRKQPFEPFRLQLSNGDSYVVRHPEFAALTRHTVIICIAPNQRTLPDRFVQVDLLHVVAIEEANGGRNGRKRKARGK